MTRTIQPVSSVYLSEKEKNISTNKSETDDIASVLLALFDSMNNLCESLKRLEYVFKRKHSNPGGFTF